MLACLILGHSGVLAFHMQAQVVFRWQWVHRCATAQLQAPGWVSAVDEATGQIYWYNEHTGASQWEAPAAQALWRLLPTSGVRHEYQLQSGDQQVLGYYDMIEQPHGRVSEAQCVVQVAADGTASLASVGERPTSMRAHGRAPWFALRSDSEPHVLVNGQQINLDDKNPGGAVFTCQLEGY